MYQLQMERYELATEDWPHSGVRRQGLLQRSLSKLSKTPMENDVTLQTIRLYHERRTMYQVASFSHSPYILLIESKLRKIGSF